MYHNIATIIKNAKLLGVKKIIIDDVKDIFVKDALVPVFSRQVVYKCHHLHHPIPNTYKFLNRILAYIDF